MLSRSAGARNEVGCMIMCAALALSVFDWSLRKPDATVLLPIRSHAGPFEAILLQMLSSDLDLAVGRALPVSVRDVLVPWFAKYC